MRRLAKRGRAPGRVCGKPRTSLHFRWGPPCEPGRRDTGGGRKSTIGDGHIAVWRLRSSAGSGRRRFSTSPARATPENMGARPANADCTRLGTPAGTVTGQSRRDENHKPLTERHFLTVFGSHPKALQGRGAGVAGCDRRPRADDVCDRLVRGAPYPGRESPKLAVATLKRTTVLPDIPTMTSSGSRISTPPPGTAWWRPRTRRRT